jgi:N-acetylmuramoyl-L-alanine amidase
MSRRARRWLLYRFFVWPMLVLLSCSACGARRVPTPPSSAPPTPPPQVSPQSSGSGARVAGMEPANPAGPQTIVHEVAPLESVWRLSKMYEVPEQAIYEANHLKPGDTIQIGQKLIIPNAKALRNVIPLYASAKWKYVVIHHTATEIGKATIIHNSHHDRGFWAGLGYDFLIDNGTLGKGDGQIEVSPRWIKQQEGAHCKAADMNSKGIGVALVGNFNSEQPTPAQIKSLLHLTTTLCKYYRIPASRVVSHGGVPGAKTDCPGKHFPWKAFISQLSL